MAGVIVAAATASHASFFDNVPELALRETERLMIASHAQPALFGPASGGTGYSYYVFGIGRLTEIKLDSGVVSVHPVEFDSQNRSLYSSGADKAWVGPDRRLYFGLAGKPARIGRYDPAAAKMELLGALDGHAILATFYGPGGKLYAVTYPCMLNEIDIPTGSIRKLGRLTEDGLYPQGEFWVGTNGLIYGSTGPRPKRFVSINPVSGVKTSLAELPKPEKAVVPVADFPDMEKQYAVQLTAEGDKASIVITPKNSAAPPRTVTFACSTVDRDVQAFALGPDGRIFGSGSYREFVYNPKTDVIERPVYQLSIYDYVSANGLLYMCGYPNARLAVLDPARPVETHGRKAIWEMNDKTFNPREIVCLYNIPTPSDQSAGGFLAMKRAMSMAVGRDGRLYIGSTGSRQMTGGALAITDLKTEKTEIVRAPFTGLGIYEVCAIDGGRQLGIATAVSPDPLVPGKEPPAAKIFVYDVARASIVHEDAPLGDCKILTALAQVPGTRLLVGLGLRGVEPNIEADNHYSGNHDIFFYDLDAKKTVKRIPLDFSVDRNFGRAFAEGPDGRLWLCGGGGLIRIDAKELTVEPVARIGRDGNLLFIGKTLYLGGAPGLRIGDIAPLLKARKTK